MQSQQKTHPDISGEPWSPEYIKFCVREKGENLRQMAIRHGFYHTTFMYGIRRKMPNVHQIIADFLGEPVHVIWPQFYSHPNEKPFLSPLAKKPAKKASVAHKIAQKSKILNAQVTS